ncbi:MAG: histone deacetylase [Pseudomonadota bacterium]
MRAADDQNRGPTNIKVFWSPLFDLPVAAHRRFPYSKYRLLKERLVGEGIVSGDHLFRSPLADRETLLLAHDVAYVDRVLGNALSADELRRIGFQEGVELAERARASVGGAVASAQAALETGLAGHLAGGTHHAHADHGSGFCILNDHAVAALKLLDTGAARRVAILDLDVHQGDGNAAILATEPRALVVSVHGANNFPFEKATSDVDLELPDGAGDDAYCAACAQATDIVLAWRPDIVLFQAGVDALATDRLGRLDVTLAGLARRDLTVFETLGGANIPISMAIGGGYADPITATVDAYAQTYRVAKDVYGF